MMKTSNGSEYAPATGLFAQILAGERITVATGYGHTASFNTTTRTLELPRYTGFTEHAWNLFIAHEVGHALFTPANTMSSPRVQGWTSKYNVTEGQIHTVLNVLEDVRIERLIREKYRGLSGFFSRGYNELVSKNFFGSTLEEIQTKWAAGQYKSLDSINLYAKIGSLASLTLVKPNHIKWFNAALAAQTWEDVLNVAEDILTNREKIEESKPNESSKPDGKPNKGEKKSDEPKSNDAGEDIESSDDDDDDDDSDSSEGDSDSSETESKPSEGDSKGEEKPEKSEKTDEEGESSSASDDSTDNDSKSESNETIQADSNKSGEGERDPLESETQSAADRKLEQAASYNSNAPQFLSADLSSMNANDIKLNELLTTWGASAASRSTLHAKTVQYKRQSSGLLSSMIAGFRANQSAKVARKNQISRNGEIDPLKLASYKTTEDIFLRHIEKSDGQNHGFVLNLDFSSSMRALLPTILWQTINLVWLAESIRVPVEVYGFTTSGYTSEGRLIQLYDSASPRKNEAMAHLLALIMIHSGVGSYSYYGVPTSTLPKMIADDVASLTDIATGDPDVLSQPNSQLGNTPLYSSLVASTTHIRNFRMKNRIEKCVSVWLTDGDDTGGLRLANGSKHQADKPLVSLANGKTYTSTNHASEVYFNLHRDLTGATTVVIDLSGSLGQSANRYLSTADAKKLDKSAGGYSRGRRYRIKTATVRESKLAKNFNNTAPITDAYIAHGVAAIPKSMFKSMGPDVVVATDTCI